ncbi:aminotransferase class I/II-fold pyridoxal phosphate-dependent enzyme [Corynebacterium sp. 153RC1]|uniref:MalY/PatB family protein n=1 Tax=unclassified Corynebacterium TaxID=2624378 RepID=UPI00211C7265|nr:MULTISPECIES: aminotransferase class I/II-fold pyridoxal phosphate-dependent enzyme [unclassified Corynebacterium]MCQ9371673.1 aminotransferase class I/II-fold pyridoxal phosphate-dependent enzyme [Corynebacterium sp. 35RC1]MCQ9352375.1 aminotransferase class I/II-fold pyridoxal phosphate-dependent enzyme [Corynebacterium sp. 209RC1]MCQ9354235.1 aminotransferase class I/II-fold pyridoxal phosphate-dependent enzyme [Corynebacterium sp. 1222RC1]MCQ9356517.1 aminotransferase class I/II-fold pyr
MEFPSLAELKNRNTMKWTRYPDDVLPLWVAESDFSTCPAVLKAVRGAVERESFGYPPDGSLMTAEAAAFYQRRYGFQAKPEWIFPLPDVVRGVYLAVEHYTPAGSPVIVPIPAYPPFFQTLAAAEREGIFINATGSESGASGLSLEEIEQGFADGARSIILASPFNPLGLAFSEQWLRELVEIAAKYHARVIVDEIHAPLVLDGSHVVAAGVSPLAAEVCITVTATSKAWNTAGLKCAQMIFSNPEDVKVWNNLSAVHKDGVSTLGLVAAEAAYRDGEDFLDKEIAYLKSNRDYLLEALPNAVPGIEVVAPEATFLMWLDFTNAHNAELAAAPSEFLLKHAKVMLNDGSWFGPEFSHCARLNFATSREILEQAVQQIKEAVQ